MFTCSKQLRESNIKNNHYHIEGRTKMKSLDPEMRPLDPEKFTGWKALLVIPALVIIALLIFCKYETSLQGFTKEEKELSLATGMKIVAETNSFVIFETASKCLNTDEEIICVCIQMRGIFSKKSDFNNAKKWAKNTFNGLYNSPEILDKYVYSSGKPLRRSSLKEFFSNFRLYSNLYRTGEPIKDTAIMWIIPNSQFSNEEPESPDSEQNYNR